MGVDDICLVSASCISIKGVQILDGKVTLLKETVGAPLLLAGVVTTEPYTVQADERESNWMQHSIGIIWHQPSPHCSMGGCLENVGGTSQMQHFVLSIFFFFFLYLEKRLQISTLSLRNHYILLIKVGVKFNACVCLLSWLRPPQKTVRSLMSCCWFCWFFRLYDLSLSLSLFL